MSHGYFEGMPSAFHNSDDDGCKTCSVGMTSAVYDYNMQTSWKAVFGLASVLFQKLSLGVDYEFTHYASAKFSNGNQGEDFYELDEMGVNDRIKKELKNTHNLRVGAEYDVNRYFCLRGGYSY